MNSFDDAVQHRDHIDELIDSLIEKLVKKIPFRDLYLKDDLFKNLVENLVQEVKIAISELEQSGANASEIQQFLLSIRDQLREELPYCPSFEESLTQDLAYKMVRDGLHPSSVRKKLISFIQAQIKKDEC